MHPPTRSAAAAALILAAASLPGAAQNCSNVSVGLTPLSDLGAGAHQGFEGGLFPGGTNVRPLAHEVAGLAAAAGIVPLDPQGRPDPDGRIVFMSIGMSNAAMHFGALVQQANADPLRHPAVLLFNGAHGGIPAEEMDEPDEPYWTTILPQKMQQAGVTPQEVQVAWMLQANASPSATFPGHAQVLQQQMADIVRILKTTCPNLRVLYGGSRIYAGYAVGPLNPEPYAYEQSFAVKWLVQQQLWGDPALNWDPDLGPVQAPWITWGPYTWADGLVPRGDGLIWECPDFAPDGVHPSLQGRAKYAGMLLDFLHGDPTARSWYLAAPEPVVYGLGKPTSAGTLPKIGWTGTPSAALGDFRVTLQDAAPNRVAVGFRGPWPAALPFLGGTLHVAPPLKRMPPRMLDGSGALAYPLPVHPWMVGQVEHFSVWFRDPPHPDGTGAGIADGLQVRYQP